MRCNLPAIQHRVHTRNNPVPASGTSSPTTASTSTQSTAPVVAAQTLTVSDLKKHIKHNQTLFPTLKDEKYQDSWHRSFVNQCRRQDLKEIINPNYRPQTVEEQEIFEWKQKWTYAVLESKVLTSKGKETVRHHDKDANAQLVHKELLAHHTSSTSAQIAAQDIQSYFTKVKLGDGRFRGSATDFITHLQQQFLLYEKLTQTTLPDVTN